MILSSWVSPRSTHKQNMILSSSLVFPRSIHNKHDPYFVGFLEINTQRNNDPQSVGFPEIKDYQQFMGY
ncbi:hypothetical protein AHAS_Ahas13G0303900 [Arachis hypogaea]